MFEAIPSRRRSSFGTVAKSSPLDEIPRVSLYTVPPTSDIDIEQLEAYAVDRTQVYREFSILEWSKDNAEKNHERIKKVVRSYLPLDPRGVSREAYEEAVRKDVVSHWICRLAFCGSPDDRDWFVKQEEALLKWRLREYKDAYGGFFGKFLEDAKLSYDRVPPEEFDGVRDRLIELARSQKDTMEMQGKRYGWVSTDGSAHTCMDYFKVPFDRVLSLVSSHKVFLRDGFAFVHKSDVIPLIMSTFKDNLREGLERAAKLKVRDTRMPMVLDGLARGYLGSDYGAMMPKGSVDLGQMDAISKEHFPLCMRHMHEKLRTNHHLRHGARMQYGLFLKGIGLTLEQALQFWRSEFLRTMDEDKFKAHAYNIRHNYGKEGRRADYTPYSCIKIINSGPSTIDDHGCPFKHFSAEKLVEQLIAYGRTPSEVKGVMQEVKRGNWGLACRRYYRFSHPTQDISDVIINHPNEYYSASIKGTPLDPENMPDGQGG